MSDLFTPGAVSNSALLRAAEGRRAIALANPGDDRYNLSKEQRSVEWLQNPSFCVSPTLADHEEYRRTGKLPAWNPGRHTQSKNPSQCESKFMYDLATGKGYREDPWNIGKNVAAGVVNALIPGSDLGDSWSEGQAIGGILGTVGSLFINPAKAAANVGNMSVLSNIISGIGRAASSPLGQVATSLIPSFFPPSPPTAAIQAGTRQNQTPLQAAPSIIRQEATRYLPNIAEPRQTISQALAFGDVKVGGYEVKKTNPMPWYVWAGGGLLLLGGILFLIFKRKR